MNQPRTQARSLDSQERRLADYFVVVRERWVSALIAGLLVIAGFFVWTLYSDSVYETSATIQLQENDAEQRVLAELSSIEAPSSIETEMEVMRSYRVAEGAARDERTGLTTVALEKDAYRPLASVARRLGQRGPPAHIRVRTKDQEPARTRRFEFRFDDAGTTVTVISLDAEDDPGVRVEGFAPGQRFEVAGHEFTVEVVSLPYAGRTFEVHVRTVADAARWLQEGQTIDLVGDRTGIARVAFAAGAPYVARDGANALALSYLERRKERRLSDLESTERFLDKQIGEVEKALRDAESDRDRFMVDARGYEARARAATAVRDQSDLRVQLVELESDKASAERDMAAWRGASSFDERLNLIGTIASDDVTSTLARDYLKQVKHVEVLRSENSDEVPIVKTALAQLKADKAAIERRLAVVVKATVQRLERDVELLDAKIAETKDTAAALAEEIRRYPQIEQELLDKSRVVEGHRRRLELLASKKVEVAISTAAGQVAAAAPLDEAPLVTRRKSPNVIYMGVLGVLFGMLAGIGIAFVRDAMDHKVRSARQLEEELGLATYASIPAFSSVRRKDRKHHRGPLVSVDAPRSVIAEAYRSLRANIRFASVEKQLRAIAITSALSGEGKTVTTLNLATALAQGGSRVVVIDADMRRSMVHTYMGADRAPGLTEILLQEARWRDALQRTSVEGFDIVTAGRHHDSPAFLLDSKTFQQLLAELREEYEYVLLDMPPVLAVADAAPFFASLDGVLLLCRSGRAPAGFYQGAREQVERLGGTVLGTIFNGFDARRVARRAYGYSGYYGYHAYYGYEKGASGTSRGKGRGKGGGSKVQPRAGSAAVGEREEEQPTT